MKLSLRNEIVEWLKLQQYCYQFAGVEILENKKVTDDLVEKTLRYLLLAEGLLDEHIEQVEIAFDKLTEKGIENQDKIYLHELKDLKNVNALAENQCIKFSENLTLIYGSNGTGKTGYIRLLNNIFKSRGDKLILQNIFDKNYVNKDVQPTCKLSFLNNSEQIEMNYPDCLNEPYLNKFIVFDTKSIKVHIEEENKLIFSPLEFDFFNHFVNLIGLIKKQLSIKIQNAKVSNTFTVLFKNKNKISKFINNINKETEDDELNSVCDFNERDRDRLDYLKNYLYTFESKFIYNEIARLTRNNIFIKNFYDKIKVNNKNIKAVNIKECIELINTYNELDLLSRQNGIESLTNYQINNIGSTEWRNFVKAAYEYSSTVKRVTKENYAYPDENDKCIFCLQELTSRENRLINTYWEILKSAAEREMHRVQEKIRSKIKLLKSTSNFNFTTDSQVYNIINEIENKKATELLDYTSKLDNLRSDLLNSLVNKSPDAQLDINVGNEEGRYLLEVIERHFKVINELKAKQNSKEKAKIEIELAYLKDKELISTIRNEVLKYLREVRWFENANDCYQKISTKFVTLKEKELYIKYINKRYIDTFKKETALLDGPSVVELIQRGEKGETFRKLVVNGVAAGKILSEGEQKAITLADLLTESELDPGNCGLIFDDPVNSLDQNRRNKIAVRLAELSSKKQVIIFTHDIPFFLQIYNYAESIEDIDISINTLRKIDNDSGITKPELPWIAQNVKKRIGFLKDELVRITKMKTSNDDEEYLKASKYWFGLVRETWERSIEERLFNGVIERFSISVQTQKLKKVVINDELIESITKGMTSSSKWLHDTSPELGIQIPSLTDLEENLKLIEEFSKKCQPH
jgi:energy-coupling factor transporter ATP-binding protein EcfA2